MERAAARGVGGVAPGMELGGEFPVQVLLTKYYLSRWVKLQCAGLPVWRGRAAAGLHGGGGSALRQLQGWILDSSYWPISHLSFVVTIIEYLNWTSNFWDGDLTFLSAITNSDFLPQDFEVTTETQSMETYNWLKYLVPKPEGDVVQVSAIW